LVSAILRDNPPSVTDIRPDLPSDLARIIRRCLEKDPRHRVQTARRLFAGGSPSKVLD
jgi:serine/threonine protein kinase